MMDVGYAEASVHRRGVETKGKSSTSSCSARPFRRGFDDEHTPRGVQNNGMFVSDIMISVAVVNLLRCSLR